MLNLISLVERPVLVIDHTAQLGTSLTGQLKTQPLWLVWIGIEMPPLKKIWQLYLRRFTIEHWYRLAKQTLHWTLPKLSTPEQCQRCRYPVVKKGKGRFQKSTKFVS